MSYQTLTTNLGLAKIAAAIGSGTTITLPTIKLGDGNGNPVTPSPTQIDLVRVVYSGPTNSLTVSQSNPNRVTAELVVPANVGGFTVREAGIYDSAGALIFVCNFPNVYKPLPSEGAARDLVVRIVFEVVNSGAINLVIDTNVTVATRAWVTSNFTLAALLPGGTTYQILRKKSNANGDTEWVDPASGQNVIVDVIEENQILAASQTVVDLVTANTNSTAVYIEGVRLRNNQFSINTATRFTLTQSYPAGSRITIVQNEPNGALGQATTEVAGIVELATSAETQAGIDATRAVTPAGLSARLSLLNNYRNKLINAQGLINQRGYVSGTATTQANQYTVDRWRVVASGQSLLCSISQNVATFTAPVGGLEQVVEGLNIETGTYVLNWNGTATATVNGTSRAKGETFSLTGGSNVTVRFSNGIFSLPQLEKEIAPTAFEYRPIGTELFLCQRYYEKNYPINVSPGTVTNAYSTNFGNTDSGAYNTAAKVFLSVSTNFIVPKRSAPVVTTYSGFSSTPNRCAMAQTQSGITTYYLVNLTGYVGSNEVGLLFSVYPQGQSIVTPALPNGNEYLWSFYYTADAEL